MRIGVKLRLDVKRSIRKFTDNKMMRFDEERKVLKWLHSQRMLNDKISKLVLIHRKMEIYFRKCFSLFAEKTNWKFSKKKIKKTKIEKKTLDYTVLPNAFIEIIKVF